MHYGIITQAPGCATTHTVEETVPAGLRLHLSAGQALIRVLGDRQGEDAWQRGDSLWQDGETAERCIHQIGGWVTV